MSFLLFFSSSFVLTKENFEEWSNKKKEELISKELWEVVEIGYEWPKNIKDMTEEEKESFTSLRRKDLQARVLMSQNVDEVAWNHIIGEYTAKDSWNVLKEIYGKNDTTIIEENKENSELESDIEAEKLGVEEEKKFDKEESILAKATDPVEKRAVQNYEEEEEAPTKGKVTVEDMQVTVMKNIAGYVHETIVQIKEEINFKTGQDSPKTVTEEISLSIGAKHNTTSWKTMDAWKKEKRSWEDRVRSPMHSSTRFSYAPGIARKCTVHKRALHSKLMSPPKKKTKKKIQIISLFLPKHVKYKNRITIRKSTSTAGQKSKLQTFSQRHCQKQDLSNFELCLEYPKFASRRSVESAANF